jgi:hypothetical protein
MSKSKLLKKAYIKTEDGDVIVSDVKTFDNVVFRMPLYHPVRIYNQTIVCMGKFIEYICEDGSYTVDGSLEFKHIK